MGARIYLSNLWCITLRQARRFTCESECTLESLISLLIFIPLIELECKFFKFHKNKYWLSPANEIQFATDYRVMKASPFYMLAHFIQIFV